MENTEYDVVIVGSGIAGAIVAKMLTHAGKKVLVLEAGLEAGMALSGNNAYDNYQRYMDTYYTSLAKVPNAPYPNVKDAESPTVLDITKASEEHPDTKGYFVQKGPLPFGSDYNRSPGGTTLHWLGTCLRMLPNDFKLFSKYGIAVDWPIDYEYLKRFYEMAEHEIGVSSDVEEQRYPNMGNNFFGKEYVFPMYKIPQSYIDKKFIKNMEGAKVTLNGETYSPWCTSTPQGRNSTPNATYRYAGTVWNPAKKILEMQQFAKDTDVYTAVGAIWDPYTGQRCEGNASCVPICPVQAKYNALKTLKSSKQENITLVSQAVVTNIEIDKSGKVSSVVYKQYKNPDDKTAEKKYARGKIYVLAANAIENAKILLASEACKSSKQVGCNLMDHTVLLTWGLMKEKVFPFRGPGSTTNIPTFRDGDFRKHFAAWISPVDNWGWGWPTGSPDTDLDNAIYKLNLFGKELRDYLDDLLSRQLLLHFECEQLPDKKNCVTISKDYVDNLGNYRPIIRYNVSDYTLKAFKAAKSVSDQLFAGMGVADYTNYPVSEPDYVTYDGEPYVFRGAGHVVGTHCMGTDKGNSVVNKQQQAWDHENLFLVGAGNMCTLGTSNPTLTLAALSFAAAENILNALK